MEEQQAPETSNEQFDLNTFLTQRTELKNQVSAMFESLQKKPKFDRKDTMKIMHKLSQMVNHLDSLTEVVIRDLMIVDQRFTTMEQQIFAIANNHAVLKTTLEDKNVVTEADMKGVWESKVKPELEKKIAQAKEATTNLEKAATDLIQPVDNGPLVDVNGMPLS